MIKEQMLDKKYYTHENVYIYDFGDNFINFNRFNNAQLTFELPKKHEIGMFYIYLDSLQKCVRDCTVYPDCILSK